MVIIFFNTSSLLFPDNDLSITCLNLPASFVSVEYNNISFPSGVSAILKYTCEPSLSFSIYNEFLSVPYLKSVGIHYNEKYSLLFKNIFQYYLKNNKNKNKKINKNRILKTYTEQNKIYQHLLKKHNIKIININRYR